MLEARQDSGWGGFHGDMAPDRRLGGGFPVAEQEELFLSPSGGSQGK